MNKIPRKYEMLVMVCVALPAMLLGSTGLMTYQNLPAGGEFFKFWWKTLKIVAPNVLVLVAVVAPTARYVVTKWLLQPEEPIQPR